MNMAHWLTEDQRGGFCWGVVQRVPDELSRAWRGDLVGSAACQDLSGVFTSVSAFSIQYVMPMSRYMV
jgi:hypothetical protein